MNENDDILRGMDEYEKYHTEIFWMGYNWLPSKTVEGGSITELAGRVNTMLLDDHSIKEIYDRIKEQGLFITTRTSIYRICIGSSQQRVINKLRGE